MSASERLRTLEKETIFDRIMRNDEDEARIQKLGDVLPLIADVVEAAERERSPHHADYWTSDQECPLCNALAALRDSLEKS